MRFDPTEPLAMLPEFAATLLAHMAGSTELAGLPFASILDRERERPKLTMLDEWGKETTVPGKSGSMIAIVPVWGALSPDGYWGTSLDDLARTVTLLDNNPNVSKILLNVTSPGGTVTGTPEAADAIRAVRDRGETKIVALANGLMASAAMWIGAAAEEVVITPSGEAGSIGVIAAYADWSKAYESAGIKVDIMRTPRNKARFSGVEPMTEEMRQHVETRIGQSYEKFKRAMASNRGIRIDQVEGKFGGGEMLRAEDAVEAGLVDRIGTLDQTIARMVGNRKAPAGARAALAKAMIGT